jgi:hypothetical protein
MNKEKVIMPLWDYIIMELPADKKSTIVVPDTVDKKKLGTLELEVVFVGPDVLHVKPHDRLIFNPAAVVNIGIDAGRLGEGTEKKMYYMVGEKAVGAIVSGLRKIEKSPRERLPK